MSLPVRRAAVLLLLAAGLALWLVIGSGRGMGPVRWVVFLAAIGVGAIPAVAGRVHAVLERVRHPSPRARERTAVLVALVATAYFTFTAFNQDRDFFPKTHDEGSYLLQMQHLAHGRLWMPRHELADFFETFYVIVDPVYASKYFPGTALMFVPTMWAGWPTVVLPLLASGVCVGLLYRITTELIDGAAGLLAAVLLMSLSWFRMLSLMLLSQVPMLLLGLLMFYAWLQWRRTHRRGWLAALGAFAGWAAITRPVDAVCYASVVACALVIDLWRRRVNGREWAIAGGLLAAGAAPFLTLQLVFNKGVTGSFTQTPFGHYVERDQPLTSFGFHTYDPSREPVSTLLQKRDYYRSHIQPFIRRHGPDMLLQSWVGRSQLSHPLGEAPRLPMLIDTTMPFRVLLPFACAGVLGLTCLRRQALWATLPLMIALYLPYTFYFEHYGVTVAPAVILSVLLGGEALAAAWPRFAGAIRSSFALGVAALALLSTHELNGLATLLDGDEQTRLRHEVTDENFRSDIARFVHSLPEQIDTRAVVLFRYTTGDNIIEEPVYNNTAPWPDEQAVVRAHDLGERNVEIARYYAERQPERHFYRFDRKGKTLTYLGTARQLLAQLTQDQNNR